MTKGTKQPPEGVTAGAYAALVGEADGPSDGELRDLLAAADLRAVPALTETADESRLKALVAIVRERTHAEDLEVFRAALDNYGQSHDRTAEIDTVLLASVLCAAVADVRKRQRHETAANAASARQPAMKEARAKVKALWLERQAGMHPRLRTNEQFAIECLRRWPHDLRSMKTILNWCTHWGKERKGIPPN